MTFGKGQFQKKAASLAELQASYDGLYRGWMGRHKNLGQAARMLDLLQVGPGTRLLDVACGMGDLLDLAERRGARACGIDLSATGLSLGAAHAPARRLVLGDGERLPFPSGCFDAVTCLGSLEHFIHPAAGAREMSRVTRDGGRAAILLPNSHHLRSIYNVWRFGEVLSDFQDYEQFATRREWERMLVESGWRVVATHKYDLGWARIHRPGRTLAWLAYNALFRVLGGWWIPLNLTYTFIFLCEKDA